MTSKSLNWHLFLLMSSFEIPNWTRIGFQPVSGVTGLLLKVRFSLSPDETCTLSNECEVSESALTSLCSVKRKQLLEQVVKRMFDQRGTLNMWTSLQVLNVLTYVEHHPKTQCVGFAMQSVLCKLWIPDTHMHFH